MVSGLYSGFEPCFHGASLHPGVQMVTGEFTPLHTQVYKWLPANLLLGGGGEP